MMALVLAPTRSDCARSRTPSVRSTNTPMTTAYSMATAPASVGVNTPPRMPPMMMSGTTSPRAAPRSVRATVPSEKRRSLTGKLRRRALTHTRAMIEAPTSRPGTTPMRNSLPTEIPPP